MNGFKNIKIKNFRGIENLEISDLGRVNIFVGQNNSGKSTILEAIFLLTGMESPDTTIQDVHFIRTWMDNVQFNDIVYLFHKMNTAIKPEFFAEDFEGDKRTLLLNLAKSNEEQIQELHTNVKTRRLTDGRMRQNTLETHFTTNIKNNISKYYRPIIFRPDGIITKRVVTDYSEKYKVSFIDSDSIMDYNTVAHLTDLIKFKQKNIVLEHLAHFDPKITDIDILQDEIYIDFEYMPEKMPLRMAGDGMRRYLHIVAASANSSNNIILIDEIDNGLHYSTYKKLWEAIFALATSSNKQIFVTTHNAETLKQLAEMLSEHPEYQQEMHLYTIAKTLKKQHQAYLYTYETLSFACENDIEIRGLV